MRHIPILSNSRAQQHHTEIIQCESGVTKPSA